MSNLYPLKFKPILKNKIWGGSKLNHVLHKQSGNTCGESWEISSVEGNVSVVSNGYLEGNTLDELIEVYMGDLVGEAVYDKFGLQFPLLVKFIDASDDLSVQVHPSDELALERHNSYGKTEMWYVLQADPNAELTIGFNSETNSGILLEKLENKKIRELLNFEKVKAGDVFFLPAGRVHSIGKGILLAEIQQTSDITYRLYDWDRPDENGKMRELHIEQALDAIDYKFYGNYKTTCEIQNNQPVNLVNCEYFTTNILQINKLIKRDFHQIDSFVIYMCVAGNVQITDNNRNTLDLKTGETVLIPNEIDFIEFSTEGESVLLEIYIE